MRIFPKFLLTNKMALAILLKTNNLQREMKSPPERRAIYECQNGQSHQISRWRLWGATQGQLHTLALARSLFLFGANPIHRSTYRYSTLRVSQAPSEALAGERM